MNIHEPAPSMTCSRMELILPLLEDGEIDPVSTDAALEHLRTCAHCQRERDRYRALDQALRDRFGFSSVRPHSTEDIMQHITERDQSPEHTSRATTPAPQTGPRRFNRALRPWLSGLGAVAVVVLLLGMAALLFGGRFGLGPGARGGPPRYTFAGTQGLFADVSMVSPTEGWALAQVTKTPDGKSTPNTVTFYHDVGGAWTPVVVTLSDSAARALREGGPGGFNGTISMDSATDGWALASNFNRGSVLFHYTGGKWHEVEQGLPSGGLAGIQAISAQSVWAFSGGMYSGQPASIFHFDGTSWIRQNISGIDAQSGIAELQMSSDRLGWALVYHGDGPNQVIQYAGNNTWTVHSTLNAGNLGNISGLAMVSPTEGWAIGQRGIDGPSSVTYGVPVPQILYHYTGGQWRSVPLHFNDGVTFVNLGKIGMLSATDGWIIAQDQNLRPGITASGIERRTILLHYDGNSWQQVQSPDAGGDVSSITGMAFSGGSGWACGFVAALPDGQNVQDDTVSVYGSPMLWRYANGGWTLYQQK